MEDLVICRCEEVLLSDVLTSIEEGAQSISGIKARVRLGMGPCQGRVCQPIVQQILGDSLQRVRPPVRPLIMEEL